jgi:glutathione S-transferase
MRYSNGSFDEILLESGLVSQFLADAHPSHLLPASDSSPTAPLFRYRVNFFVDTYFTKVNTYLYAVIRATNDEEKKAKADEWVEAIEKEIEPLLHDANPFFGGSKEMTLAEVFSLSTVSLELLHIACCPSTALTRRPPSRSKLRPSSSASTTLRTISSFPPLSQKP